MNIGWNVTLLWRQPPTGETIETTIAHGAANGVKHVTIRLGEGDAPSYVPRYEVRPGEFYVGDPNPVTRNSGEITSHLYQVGETIPNNCPLIRVLDACDLNGIGVTLQLGDYGNLTGEFNRHPYALNRITSAGGVSTAGQAGWLTDFEQFWSDAQAKAAYKNRMQSVVDWFGDHPALYAMDFGNEYLLYYWTYRDRVDAASYNTLILNWYQEMATYLWAALPGADIDKPMITASTAIYPATGNIADISINQVYDSIAAAVPSNKVFITWHDYGNAYTLSRILSGLRQFSNLYPVRIGENWPFRAGPLPVPSQYQDINLDSSSYSATAEMPPYAHTRMYPYLMATMPKSVSYNRWWSFIDGYGQGTWNDTIKRIVEVTAHEVGFLDSCSSLERNVNDYVDTTGQVDVFSIGTGNGLVAIFVAGAGVVTLTSPISGQFSFQMYDWSDGSVLHQSIDTFPLTIDLGDYPRGLLVGLGQLTRRGKLRGITTGNDGSLTLVADDGTTIDFTVGADTNLVDASIAEYALNADPPIFVNRNIDGTYDVATGVKPWGWA